MSRKTKLLSYIQQLGKSFMFPVSLLAFLGMFLGIGASFTTPSLIESMPFLKNEIIQLICRFCLTWGGIAFKYFPVLFAVGIPMGLASNNKGVAAYSGFIGIIALNIGTNFYLQETGLLAPIETMKSVGQNLVLGIQTIDMGILSGIIVGIIVHKIHEKFQYCKVHDAFSFFGGIRAVPIVTSFVLSICGLLVPFIWPIFSYIIKGLGVLVAKSGVFGPFFYGIGIMLLKPFGMHHILLASVRFTEVGGTEIVDGESVSGALNIFFSQLTHGLPISAKATAFLSQGWMLSFIFALPAIALAIYHTAHKENRPKIKGLLISAAIISIFPGISEPVEFLFLFIALPLYIIHSLLLGISAVLVSLAGVIIGNTDGGVVDLIIFGIMQGSYTKWWLIIFMGIPWFVLYYCIFKWYIIKYNVLTPGREIAEDNSLNNKKIYDDNNQEIIIPDIFTKDNGIHDPRIILFALGNKNNIVTIDNCVTRLRLELKDMSLVDELLLKKAGSIAVLKIDNHNLQVVIGAKVQEVKDGIEKLL